MSEEADAEAINRAIQRLQRYEKESRFLIKGVEDRQVLEQVFDRRTLVTLYGLINRRFFRVLNGVVATGKEARVYRGVSEDGRDIAVKIFATVAAEFKRRLPYVEGDPRFHHIPRETSKFINLWAKKEFKNLQLADQAGVDCPKPIVVRNNVLLMEFIGEKGMPAPLLAEVQMVSRHHYEEIIRNVEKLYGTARLVHADLSEYNVMLHGNRPVLFDFGSAVDAAHPLSSKFLARDIFNINRFFSRNRIRISRLETIYKRIAGEPPPSAWSLHLG